MLGDCIEQMKTLPAKSVQTCVTSPPYFGLRDYGHVGQIGLEDTPDAFVARLVEVFREVRRVLRDDGTLWLNLGDSYAANRSYQVEQTKGGAKHGPAQAAGGRSQRAADYGLKVKDLIGIPWRVAFALQQPFYTGKVASELDRVWLAAMLDAEGCITASEYETGGRTKSNIYISITNASVPVIEKCGRLFPQAKENVYQKGGVVNRTVFRWDVERMDQKSIFLREIYPYLVAKRKQAVLGYTFIEMQRGLPSKKKGYLPDQQEKRSWLVKALSTLNKGGDVDLPDWVVEPPSLFEPGFYLRQDIIWHKPNPMPESVRDRCTKAHEYVFLLSKGPRYFFDSEAIKEPVAESSVARLAQPTLAQQAGSARVPGKTNGNMKAVGNGETRNRRSVWTVTTKPFKGAHFATFPPDLIEPCILAGCPVGGTVLDPFGGSGTTAGVAIKHGRKAILCELNPEYATLVPDRVATITGRKSAPIDDLVHWRTEMFSDLLG